MTLTIYQMEITYVFFKDFGVSNMDFYFFKIIGQKNEFLY